MAYVKCLMNVVSSTIPDGKTVTPTDDISIWLACGGRSETYTTLSQVLADSTCLSALIADSNAVDYLVRSTTWASDVCGDSSAMSYIGLNNYASNTLLADSTWCSAICNSTYFESVLNVKVPTMTSNTTPSGVASGSSIYSAGYDYYKAFDGNDNSAWIMSASDSNPYLRYAFPSANKCKRVDIKYRVVTSAGYPLSANTLKIQDSSGTHDFEQFTISATSGETDNSYAKTLLLSNDIDYEGYQLKFSGNAVSVSSGVLKSSIMIKEIQFYGRADI